MCNHKKIQLSHPFCWTREQIFSNDITHTVWHAQMETEQISNPEVRLDKWIQQNAQSAKVQI